MVWTPWDTLVYYYDDKLGKYCAWDDAFPECWAGRLISTEE